MADEGITVATLFANTEPIVGDIYARLLAALHELGPLRAEPKQTAIHLAHRVDFAEVHPHERYLILDLHTAQPLDSPRIIKREQASPSRWRNELQLASPTEIDAELRGWLRAAYDLG